MLSEGASIDLCLLGVIISTRTNDILHIVKEYTRQSRPLLFLKG